ncbi:hypothetical protein EDEG_03626 [Edhazardia aedis USNM 41457]|uniref:Uncharacterized protein n=1 Tax=Edhazardia aedis (strain USNM 41457) TaxID=1003232 RepID=J9DH29_EDHAE|nr:hypothetical protein EDEG_03626 [Edhazardia aedis USNM 41457]|eukprot:EJW01910.1 hypothetical protein EDEG_03626 [Edhazardia aedis USNM 41457]
MEKIYKTIKKLVKEKNFSEALYEIEIGLNICENDCELLFLQGYCYGELNDLVKSMCVYVKLYDSWCFDLFNRFGEKVNSKKIQANGGNINNVLDNQENNSGKLVVNTDKSNKFTPGYIKNDELYKKIVFGICRTLDKTEIENIDIDYIKYYIKLLELEIKPEMRDKTVYRILDISKRDYSIFCMCFNIILYLEISRNNGLNDIYSKYCDENTNNYNLKNTDIRNERNRNSIIFHLRHKIDSKIPLKLFFLLIYNPQILKKYIKIDLSKYFEHINSIEFKFYQEYDIKNMNYKVYSFEKILNIRKDVFSRKMMYLYNFNTLFDFITYLIGFVYYKKADRYNLMSKILDENKGNISITNNVLYKKLKEHDNTDIASSVDFKELYFDFDCFLNNSDQKQNDIDYPLEKYSEVLLKSCIKFLFKYLNSFYLIQDILNSLDLSFDILLGFLNKSDCIFNIDYISNVDCLVENMILNTFFDFNIEDRGNNYNIQIEKRENSTEISDSNRLFKNDDVHEKTDITDKIKELLTNHIGDANLIQLTYTIFLYICDFNYLPNTSTNLILKNSLNLYLTDQILFSPLLTQPLYNLNSQKQLNVDKTCNYYDQFNYLIYYNNNINKIFEYINYECKVLYSHGVYIYSSHLLNLTCIFGLEELLMHVSCVNHLLLSDNDLISKIENVNRFILNKLNFLFKYSDNHINGDQFNKSNFDDVIDILNNSSFNLIAHRNDFENINDFDIISTDENKVIERLLLVLSQNIIKICNLSYSTIINIFHYNIINKNEDEAKKRNLLTKNDIFHAYSENIQLLWNKILENVIEILIKKSLLEDADKIISFLSENNAKKDLYKGWILQNKYRIIKNRKNENKETIRSLEQSNYEGKDILVGENIEKDYLKHYFTSLKSDQNNFILLNLIASHYVDKKDYKNALFYYKKSLNTINSQIKDDLSKLQGLLNNKKLLVFSSIPLYELNEILINKSINRIIYNDNKSLDLSYNISQCDINNNEKRRVGNSASLYDSDQKIKNSMVKSDYRQSNENWKNMKTLENNDKINSYLNNAKLPNNNSNITNKIKNVVDYEKIIDKDDIKKIINKLTEKLYSNSQLKSTKNKKKIEIYTKLDIENTILLQHYLKAFNSSLLGAVNCYTNLSAPKKAIRLLENNIMNTYEYYYVLGKLYYNIKDYKNAFDILNLALKFNDSFYVNYMIAKICLNNGLLEMSLKSFQKCAKFNFLSSVDIVKILQRIGKFSCILIHCDFILNCIIYSFFISDVSDDYNNVSELVDDKDNYENDIHHVMNNFKKIDHSDCKKMSCSYYNENNNNIFSINISILNKILRHNFITNSMEKNLQSLIYLILYEKMKAYISLFKQTNSVKDKKRIDEEIYKLYNIILDENRDNPEDVQHIHENKNINKNLINYIHITNNEQTNFTNQSNQNYDSRKNDKTSERYIYSSNSLRNNILFTKKLKFSISSKTMLYIEKIQFYTLIMNYVHQCTYYIRKNIKTTFNYNFYDNLVPKYFYKSQSLTNILSIIEMGRNNYENTFLKNTDNDTLALILKSIHFYKMEMLNESMFYLNRSKFIDIKSAYSYCFILYYKLKNKYNLNSENIFDMPISTIALDCLVQECNLSLFDFTLIYTYIELSTKGTVNDCNALIDIFKAYYECSNDFVYSENVVCNEYSIFLNDILSILYTFSGLYDEALSCAKSESLRYAVIEYKNSIKSLESSPDEFMKHYK